MRVMLYDMGIPMEKLDNIPTLFHRQNLFEALVELNSLRKATTEIILRTEATWVSPLTSISAISLPLIIYHSHVQYPSFSHCMLLGIQREDNFRAFVWFGSD